MKAETKYSLPDVEGFWWLNVRFRWKGKDGSEWVGQYWFKMERCLDQHQGIKRTLQNTNRAPQGTWLGTVCKAHGWVILLHVTSKVPFDSLRCPSNLILLQAPNYEYNDCTHFKVRRLYLSGMRSLLQEERRDPFGKRRVTIWLCNALLLRIYSKEMNYVHTKLVVNVHSKFFYKRQTGDSLNGHQLVNEKSKRWYIYTMEYYSEIKRNEVVCATT